VSAVGNLKLNPTERIEPPLERDVALFSIWIHPSSVLPSKRETAVGGSPTAFPTPTTEPATVIPASLTNARRLRGFVSFRMVTFSCASVPFLQEVYSLFGASDRLALYEPWDSNRLPEKSQDHLIEWMAATLR
jgi:hypothetical protein